jgi:dTDP-3-amino-2,3,6-trideoxy-4-keto-D-glucose/dTDP-3-amino-3,4,6-trideoxy-alpha-D-glucose/dTDP-2,6-dideoxy-D-kanosamine transaminase
MRVPYNYLPMQFADPAPIFRDWEKLIASSEFTLGPFMEAFERKFADYIGVKHCVATNNGTDALILAFKSIGLGPGDEVVTVCNTFYATVGAIVAVGATPVFVDCDDRFQIDASAIEAAISSRTKAIVPVHWGGASPDMEAICDLAAKRGIPIVEDACMGIGAVVNGRRPGTFGRINAFSMHPLKSLNVMGDGGMVVTNDEALAAWMLKYRNHGMTDRNHIEFWGVNMRLQPLQAIVASHGLDDLPGVIEKRNVNAARLDRGLAPLAPRVTLPARRAGHLETFALYMGLFERRDELLAHLVAHEIEAKIHYPLPLHLQPAARDLGYARGSFPVAEDQADRLITLPVHQFLVAEQMDYPLDTLAQF